LIVSEPDQELPLSVKVIREATMLTGEKIQLFNLAAKSPVNWQPRVQ
jgi:hypothetical protein